MSEEPTINVPRGRHIVLRREWFEQIVALVRSRPMGEAAHLLPFITDGEDKSILTDGGEVLDLADVIAQIDAERAANANKPGGEAPPKDDGKTDAERSEERLARTRKVMDAPTG